MCDNFNWSSQNSNKSFVAFDIYDLTLVFCGSKCGKPTILAGILFWWPSILPTSTSVPISEWPTSILHKAMFLFNVGDKQALVTIPTCALPIWTQSPWFAFSFPINSSPTNFFWGFSFLFIKFSLPIKSSVFVFSGTEKPIPASKGSCWPSNSFPNKIKPASIRSKSNATNPAGIKPSF